VYRFIQANRDDYTVREMAGIFGVSCAAYYKWAKYGWSDRRRKADEELAGLIRLIQEKHCYQYGSPRMREILRWEYGKEVSRKRTARLMREHGLNARRLG
jgi:transposase